MRTVVAALLLFSSGALAAGDIHAFSSPQQERQYRELTQSLRCPRCQNNNIADSDAMIAGDMRLKVYQLLQQGKTPQEVRLYMVERYGNFVSYQPPFTLSTLILWAGPLLFVIAAGVMIVLRSRRARGKQSALDADEQYRLDALLHNRRAE